MPKGILEFSLPEENSEFKIAVNSGSYVAALEDFSNYLRNLIRYGENGKMLSPPHRELVERIQKELGEILDDKNITLFE